MAKMPTNCLHFPHGFQDGPYGVYGSDTNWYVVHKVTGIAKRIGRIRAKGKVNYFDRAVEVARDRNIKEAQK